MKNTVLIFASIFLSVNLSAQENYYTKQATGRYSTFDEHGVEHAYIYRYDSEMEEVKIYNVANRFVDVKAGFKDGRPMNGAVSIGRIRSYENSPIKRIIQVVSGIIYNELTPAQQKQTKGETFYVCMYVDTDTGKIAEVDFEFYSEGLYSRLPIDFFSRIEQAIKRHPEIVFQLTDVGRSRNYIPINWYGEPKPEGQFVW